MAKTNRRSNSNSTPPKKRKTGTIDLTTPPHQPPPPKVTKAVTFAVNTTVAKQWKLFLNFQPLVEFFTYKDVITLDMALGKLTWKWEIQLPSTILTSLDSVTDYDNLDRILHNRTLGAHYEFPKYLFDKSPRFMPILYWSDLDLFVKDDFYRSTQPLSTTLANFCGCLKYDAATNGVLRTPSTEWFFVLITTLVHVFQHTFQHICDQDFHKKKMSVAATKDPLPSTATKEEDSDSDDDEADICTLDKPVFAVYPFKQAHSKEEILEFDPRGNREARGPQSPTDQFLKSLFFASTHGQHIIVDKEFEHRYNQSVFSNPRSTYALDFINKFSNEDPTTNLPGIKTDSMFYKILQTGLEDLGSWTNTSGVSEYFSAYCAYLNDHPGEAFKLFFKFLQTSDSKSFASISNFERSMGWCYMWSCSKCGTMQRYPRLPIPPLRQKRALRQPVVSIPMSPYFILDIESTGIETWTLGDDIKYSVQQYIHKYTDDNDDNNETRSYVFLPSTIFQTVVTNKLQASVTALWDHKRSSRDLPIDIPCTLCSYDNDCKPISQSDENCHELVLTVNEIPPVLVFERHHTLATFRTTPDQLIPLLNVQESLEFTEFPGAVYQLRALAIRCRGDVAYSSYMIATKDHTLGSNIWSMNHGGNSEEECTQSSWRVNFQEIDEDSEDFIRRIHVLYYELSS